MHKYQRIRDLREDADLYQKDLAKMLNCSQQTYSDYECGKVDIPTEVLILLAKHYNTTTDYILGLTDTRLSTNELAAQLSAAGIDPRVILQRQTLLGAVKRNKEPIKEK